MPTKWRSTASSISASFACDWRSASRYSWPSAAAASPLPPAPPSAAAHAPRRITVHAEFWPTTVSGRLAMSSWGLVRTCRVSGIARAFFLQQYWKRRVGRCDVGSVVWRSSLALSHCLPTLVEAWRSVVAARRTPHRQPRIIELGCGTGCLASMAAALRGCDVTATDLPKITELARENVANNMVGRGRIALTPLAWGDAAAAARLSDQHGPFDVIVAADVLYSPDLYDALLTTLDALAAASARSLPYPAELWLAWERRHARCERAFFARMAAAGYDEPCIVPKADMHRGYRACSVALARFQLRSRSGRSGSEESMKKGATSVSVM